MGKLVEALNATYKSGDKHQFIMMKLVMGDDDKPLFVGHSITVLEVLSKSVTVFIQCKNSDNVFELFELTLKDARFAIAKMTRDEKGALDGLESKCPDKRGCVFINIDVANNTTKMFSVPTSRRLPNYIKI